jgi:hypothetical protein
MNVFGKIWNNYEEKIKKNWISVVKNEDTVIIPGDISWGMTLKEALPDFKYINDLPGKKIFLRGNHDYYFSTKNKIDNFLKENNFENFKLLHNNAYEVEDVIIAGSRGWGKTENSDSILDEKIIKREENRLILSLEYAKSLSLEKDIIVALHFPPFIGNFQEIMKKYGVSTCMYGHLHGYGHTFVKEGNIDSIEYIMVSCDYNDFKLRKIK